MRQMSGTDEKGRSAYFFIGAAHLPHLKELLGTQQNGLPVRFYDSFVKVPDEYRNEEYIKSKLTKPVVVNRPTGNKIADLIKEFEKSKDIRIIRILRDRARNGEDSLAWVLARFLRMKDEKIREEVERALRSIGEPAIEPLISIWEKSEDEELKHRIDGLLEEINGKLDFSNF